MSRRIAFTQVAGGKKFYDFLDESVLPIENNQRQKLMFAGKAADGRNRRESAVFGLSFSRDSSVRYLAFGGPRSDVLALA